MNRTCDQLHHDNMFHDNELTKAEAEPVAGVTECTEAGGQWQMRRLVKACLMKGT